MMIKGMHAIVTGGGSGMGAQTARLLAQNGAQVTVLDINAESAEKTAEETGGLGLACDVSHAESVKDALAAAREKYGPARIVVNCAGIAPAHRLAGREGPHGLDCFLKVININLVGTFNLMRLTASEMTTLDPVNDAGERGVIINTASVAAFEGQIGQIAYAASKAGVVGMTLPAARELAKFGVRVATIAPGLMDTPMLSGMTQDVQDSLIATTLFPRRLGQPDEYAKLALHIIDNQMINGTTIRLDGAVRLPPK